MREGEGVRGGGEVGERNKLQSMLKYDNITISS